MSIYNSFKTASDVHFNDSNVTLTDVSTVQKAIERFCYVMGLGQQLGAQVYLCTDISSFYTMAAILSAPTLEMAAPNGAVAVEGTAFDNITGVETPSWTIINTAALDTCVEIAMNNTTYCCIPIGYLKKNSAVTVHVYNQIGTSFTGFDGTGDNVAYVGQENQTDTIYYENYYKIDSVFTSGDSAFLHFMFSN